MTRRVAPRTKGPLKWLWLLALPALACNPLAIMSDPGATETAVAATVLAQVAPTLQAVAATPTPPPPTEVLEPTVDVAATDAAATASALEPIRRALTSYGVDPNEGHLGWTHNPVLIETTQFHEMQYASDYPALFVSDFFAETSVTWNTKTGLAGCGFIFRANADTQTFYAMGIFRGGEGTTAFNEWQDGSSGEWERFKNAPTANAENGGTNTLGVLARGDEFTLYVNGSMVDNLRNTDLAEGAVGFGAFSESGTTSCAFQDGWMWVLD